MNGYPRRPRIEDLRDEFVDRGLEGWLWLWLDAILQAYVRRRLTGRYDPKAYSPTNRWDQEGIRTLVTDFTVQVALEGGALETALRLSDDTGGVVRYLERSLHHYALDSSERSLRANLYRRLSRALKEDQALAPLAGVPGKEFYGLADWREEPPGRLPDEELPGLSRYLPELAWREWNTDRRLSPGFATEDLVTAARALVRESGFLVSASQMLAVIGQRWDLGGAELVSLDDGDQTVIRHEPSPLKMAVIEELVMHLLPQLTPRQKRILLCLIEGQTIRNIADGLELSSSLVGQEKLRINALLRELPLSNDEERLQFLGVLEPVLRAWEEHHSG